MDFTFNEEQKMIQGQVEQFVQKEYDWETRQELSNSDLGFGDKNWKTFAELGWLGISISEDNGKITLTGKKIRRKEKALIGTWRAHLNNMAQGVSSGFLYEMKIVFAHFPMKVAVKGNVVAIDNFLGEKVTRNANICGDVKVIAKGDKVTVEGNNVEDVGQTAANLERATVVKGRDIRVFQDGIYVVSKGAAQ